VLLANTHFKAPDDSENGKIDKNRLNTFFHLVSKERNCGNGFCINLCVGVYFVVL
jgi:hypothetical protein